MSDERRQAERHPLNFSVRFAELQKDGLAPEDELAGSDLSVTGVGVAGGTELRPGAKMMLILSLEDGGEELLIPAKVMWCRADGPVFQSGLKFVFLSDDGQQRIKSFVEKASELNS